MKRPGLMRALGGSLALLLAAQAVRAEADGLPAAAEVRLYGQGSGRFEVVAAPGEDGMRLARLAEDGWNAWSEPLALPDRLLPGITVRLAPADRWDFAEPWWRVVGESGGVVSVWIRLGGVAGQDRDRRWLTALAEGALYRRAIQLGAGPGQPGPAHWLAVGAAEAALVRANPAILDAWRQAAMDQGRMPPLRELLGWSGAQAATESDPCRVAAFGAWQWLRAEAGHGPAWRRFIEALLTSEAPGLALVTAYPERLGRAKAPEIELAWQTAVAGHARMRMPPFMDAGESRRRLEELDRLVVALEAGGEERVVRLGAVWMQRADEFVASERNSRISWLTGNLERIHPFYRNAAGSLGRVFLTLRDGDCPGWSLALEDWHRDLATGRELEEASTRLLDAAGP